MQRYKMIWLWGILLLGVFSVVYTSKKLWHNFGTAYVLKVEVDDTGSLALGTPVFMDGVKVGFVKDITLGRKSVIVHLNIDKNKKVPLGSLIKINYKGMIGDLIINIFRPQKFETYYKSGDTIQGLKPTSMGAVLESSIGIAKKIEEFVGEFDSGDIQKTISDLTNDIRALTNQVKLAIQKFEAEDKPKIISSIEEFKETATSINRYLNNITFKLSDYLSAYGSVQFNLQAKEKKDVIGDYLVGLKISNLSIEKVGFETFQDGYRFFLNNKLLSLNNFNAHLIVGMVNFTMGAGIDLRIFDKIALKGILYDKENFHNEISIQYIWQRLSFGLGYYSNHLSKNFRVVVSIVQ